MRERSRRRLFTLLTDIFYLILAVRTTEADAGL
jgi:hypothetical protein